MKSTNIGIICLFYRLIFLDYFESMLIREVVIPGSVPQTAVRVLMETVSTRVHLVLNSVFKCAF